MIAPKIKICFENCSKIAVYDTTGMYEITDNPTGWGTPNIDPSGITSATVSVTVPGSTTPVVFDYTAILSAAVLPVSYIEDYQIFLSDITYQSLGMTSLKDGVYSIVYTIDEVEYTMKALNICNTECCVNKMLEKAIDKYLCGNNCSQGEIAEALRARALLLQASQWAYSCGHFDEAQDLLDKAAKICKTNGCGCGCS